jgi:hypothetical protein
MTIDMSFLPKSEAQGKATIGILRGYRDGPASGRAAKGTQVRARYFLICALIARGSRHRRAGGDLSRPRLVFAGPLRFARLGFLVKRGAI